MRISLYQVLIAIVFATIAQAHDTFAQELLNRKVTIQISNQSIESVLHKIEKATEVKFMYNHQIFDSNRKISFVVENEKLEKVLERLFKPFNIDYEQAGNKIILKRDLKLISIPEKVTVQNVEIIEQTVSGKVVDDKDNSLPGVNIMLKGTQKGTTSDASGNFSIVVPDDEAVLVFSSIGFDKKEVLVGKRIGITVKLLADIKSLDEVIVVGYGTAKKATLTGSISTIDSKIFKDRGPVDNPLGALQGQVAGVTITRNSGQPGRENWNFQIRGAASTNSTEPLVIVDGLPVTGVSSLNSFNPNDIENISFLKDGSAAIYGSRAAGGVVLITTKRAKSGKVRIEYNASFSQKRVGLLPQLVDMNGWGPLIRDARAMDGFPATDIWLNYANVAIATKKAGIDWLTKDQYLAASLSGAANFGDVRDFPFFDTNEQKVLWGNATSQEHQLSVSARGEKSGYRVSLGYLNDGSLLQAGNNSNKRYNLRLSHDYQFSKKLSLESNLSIENQVIVQPTRLGDIMNNGNQPGKPASGLGLTGLPYVWGSGIGNASVNALADYGGDNTQSDVRIIGNFKFTYDILPNLKAVAAVGYSSLNTDYRTVENSIGFYDYVGTTKLADLPSRTSYQRGNKNEGNFTTNAYLEYNKKIGLDNSFRVTGGVQYERYEYNRFIAKTFDVVSGVPSSLSLSTGDATSKSVAEAQFHTALAGYFGRFNYSFKDKYLLEGNVRYDGSSKFSAANRWKPFYGVSAGWILSEEDFLKDNNIINSLKLRASYGLMGNQSGIGSYDYIQFLNLNYSTSNTASGFPILGTSPVVRITPSGTLVADDRTWETIRTQNIGLDFGLLKNRLSGSFDYFVKNNDNMLINRTYPTVLGATAPQGNNGKLQVWGWDLALTWRDKIGNFSYHIGGVLSDNQNKLLSFGGQNVIGTGTRGLNSAVEGYPINSYFGLEYAGRIQTQADLENYSKYITGNNIGIPSGGATSQANGKLALGDNMYKDLNGDGKITYPQDAKFLGTDAPRYSFSFNGGFEYKGFDFNAIFQGVGKRTLIRDGNWRIPGAVIFQAQNAAFVDQYWLPTHTDARLPRPSTTGTINNYNYFASDWVAEDGSYLRLKNIVLGYTIPAKFTQKLKVERLRVYFSGNDLWEITKIQDGWDPESTQSVANTADSENNGVSTFSQRFPLYRYLTFGLNVTF